MENKWHEQLKTPPPPLQLPSPLQNTLCSLGIRNPSLAQEYTPQSGALIWSIQGQQLLGDRLRGGGAGVRHLRVPWKSSGELLLEGPWGLPPPVLRNLSLENCKFISQKGPRAEMTSKRTNHFLQSSTELGLGGGCDHQRGASSQTCPPSCLSTAHPWLWAQRDGAKSGPEGMHGRSQPAVQPCFQGWSRRGLWKRKRALPG